MIKIIKKENPEVRKITKSINDMLPLEVCILDGEGINYGHVIMRTASTQKFEVIDLTNSGEDKCWTGVQEFLVRELFPGEKYLLELS